ncbi:MAG TPA: hypothetical protein VD837_04480 [Terriglobales bacterium]|nr:hypothetical protein [Terriglobales bacterium]
MRPPEEELELDRSEDRDEPEDREPELRPRELELAERDRELDFFAEDFFPDAFFAEDFFAAVFFAGDFLAAVLRAEPLVAERPAEDRREPPALRLLDDFLLAVFRPDVLLGIRSLLPCSVSFVRGTGQHPSHGWCTILLRSTQHSFGLRDESGENMVERQRQCSNYR